MKIVPNILQYLLAFFIIIECNSIYGYFIKPSIKGGIIFMLFFILVIFNIFKTQKNLKILLRIFISIFIWELIALILLQLADEKIVFSFKYILVVPLVFFYFANTKYSQVLQFLSKFSNIMVILTIISIIMWVLCSVLGIIKPIGVVPIEWGDLNFFKSYYYLYFETQKFDFGNFGDLVRNTGVFVEAPMFNFCLCVALGIELFLNITKSNKFNKFILIIGILTTISTTGQIYLIFVFFIKCFLLNNNGTLKKVGISFVFIPIGIAISFFALQIIMSEKAKGGSYEDRKSNIESNIYQWNKSPFLGNGYATARQENNSNSFFLLLQEGGILMISFYVFGLLLMPLYKSLKTKNYNYFVFFGLMFYLFCITIVLYNYFLILFVALGFAINMINTTQPQNNTYKLLKK